MVFRLFSKLRAEKQAAQAEEDERLDLALDQLRLIAGVEFDGDLAKEEIWWRDHFLWLKDIGYQLRSRYAPGWVPSWQGTDKNWVACEDSFWLPTAQVISAIRTSDGAHVILKRIQPSRHPHEIEISRFVASEPLRSQRENHCVAVLDVLDVPNDPDEAILILPLLRDFNDPPFETIGEIIDFVVQVCEGLQFMHKHNIAHRDCMNLNIMMDPSRMFLEPYHPCAPHKRFDMKGRVKFLSRTESSPRYLFIDFGISRRYDSLEGGAPLEPPILGGYKNVPEFQLSLEPQNPFPTDVWYLGYMLQQELLHVYRGLGFLEPLVSQMVQSDPAMRPTMDEVVSRFAPTYNALSPWRLRSRAVQKEEWILVALLRSFVHWMRTIRYVWRGFPAIPSRVM
ncbi:kinase-like domain-containing protein [Suillus clintonianus]|uniref:kinase-like domain-containing protein n=1 Tax=Suillus clintonianus TaxID=1904413 RepID=UPI001B86AE27|nr:kinase-like domain-containing protein [Suillus clintonianus]KAG2150397.1 kinase-like domain-containing protein [Suillus clintonianus]